MIALIQRVKNASCSVENTVVSNINAGLLVYLGFEESDTLDLIPKMADKLANLRIFEDAQGKMNHSLKEINGELMLIPNFTLAGYVESRRPSFSRAKNKKEAEAFFEEAYTQIKAHVPCVKGIFSATMKISALVDGPINIIIKIP